jgi:drug/metabolite transporter (DMT)-like permease
VEGATRPRPDAEPREVRVRAAALTLAGMALWTGVEALGAHVGPRYSPVQVVWTRYAVHLVVLVAVVVLRGRASRLRAQRPGVQFLRSSMMLGMPTAFVLALRVQAPNEVWSVFWLSPLIALALGALVLAEAVPPPRWWATAAGGVGAWLVLAPSTQPSRRGAVLSLVMAACFAGYVVLTRMLKEEWAESKLLFTALGVFLALTPALPTVWRTPAPGSLAIMALVGVVGLGGLWALDRALEAAPVSLFAPVAYTQLFWLLVVWAALGTEPLTPRALLGGCLILASAAYAVRAGGPVVVADGLPAASPASGGSSGSEEAQRQSNRTIRSWLTRSVKTWSEPSKNSTDTRSRPDQPPSGRSMWRR